MTPTYSVPPEDHTPADPSTPTTPVRAGTSVGQVFAFVAGFIALAAIGAAIGWSLTKSPGGHLAGVPAASSPAVPTPSVPVSTALTPSTPVTATAGFTIPDYASTQTDFMTARNQILGMKVGVALIFEGPQAGIPDGIVTHTIPAHGVAVSHGFTIKVFVAGNPPPLTVLVPAGGETCHAFGKRLAAAGFSPAYAPSQSGLVAAASPGYGQPSQWNAKVTLTCTPDGSPPVVPPPPPGPSSGPSS